MVSSMIRRLALLAAIASACTGAFAQGEPVRVGLLTPKTGPLAGPGKQMEDGLRYFLKERNQTLAGRRIELVVADTAGQPAGALTKAQELVERHKVDVLIGPLATTEALAIDDYVRTAKVPTIASSSAAEDITQRMANPWLVRATGSVGQAMHPLGDYAAKTLGYRRVATVATDFAYGHEAVAAFQRVFEDHGGRVVQRIWVPLKASDFAAYIAQIKRDVDAVYVSFSGASAIGFVRQYREYGLKGKLPLLSSHSTIDESLLKQEGDDALGIVSSTIYAAALDSSENKAYAAGFTRQTGTEPGYYSTGAYIAGMFLEEALKATGGNVEDKAAVMRALRAVKLGASPRGALRLDDYGNPIADAYIRKTERVGEKLQNSVVKVYPAQSQFWTWDPKQFLANPVYSRDFPPANHLEK